jgi:hypothetical protein
LKILLNVLTVVRNDRPGLQRTLRSLVSLIEDNENSDLVLKVHIQDGCSVDDTKRAYDEFEAGFTANGSSIVFVSEDDVSLFDAMNKASSSLIKGDLVLYLNAGDQICPDLKANTLVKCLRDLDRSSAMMAAFRSKNVYQNIEYFMPPMGCSTKQEFIKWLRFNTPVHQAIIFRVDKNFPLHYPLEFEIQADTLLIYYLIKYQGSPIFYNISLCEFELGGLSNTYISFKKVLTQIKEQSIIARFREEPLWSRKLRGFLLLIKYVLHRLLGDYFYSIHAKANQILRSSK